MTHDQGRDQDQDRPAAVTLAVALLTAGGAMLILGGVFTAWVDFSALRQVAPATVADGAVREAVLFYRGVGILAALAGAALIALAWRARRRDVRARRAAISLAFAIVVLAAVGAVLAATHILTLLSLPLIIVGALLLGRPATAAWFAGAYPGYPGYPGFPEEPQFIEYPDNPQSPEPRDG